MTHKERMIAKFGSEEKYKAFMSSIGSKGGKNSRGFSTEANRKGGKNSRKGWSYKGIVNNNHVWVNNKTGETEVKGVDKPDQK